MKQPPIAPLPRGDGPGVRGDRWVEALRDALLAAMSAEDVDVTANAEPGVLEVSTDDWTLRIEGLHDGLEGEPSSSLPPPSSPAKRPTAWVAIDDEPDAPARYRSARRAVMPPAIDRALAQADATLHSALRAALEAGGDPFSQDLVEGMRAYD